MRAITLRAGQLEFRDDVPPADVPPGEVRVRVLTAGICETDLQLVRGYMGFEGVLGHEFVGVAESGRYAGQRVVGEINCSCDSCEWCQEGLENHCPHRSVLGILNRDGAFADSLVLPEANLHPVADSIPTELATLTEPVAAAFQIPAQLALENFPHVIVLGDGRLGNLCAQVCRLSGCQVKIIGKHDDKLSRFRMLDFETQLLADVTPARTADLVVDCTGSESGLPLAVQLVKPRGTIVLKTTVAGTQTLAWAPFVIDEITLVGSRCGPFDVALKSIANGQIELRSLLTDDFPIENALKAFDRAQDRDAWKVLLRIHES